MGCGGDLRGAADSVERGVEIAQQDEEVGLIEERARLLGTASAMFANSGGQSVRRDFEGLCGMSGAQGSDASFQGRVCGQRNVLSGESEADQGRQTDASVAQAQGTSWLFGHARLG